MAFSVVANSIQETVDRWKFNLELSQDQAGALKGLPEVAIVVRHTLEPREVEEPEHARQKVGKVRKSIEDQTGAQGGLPEVAIFI